MNAGMISSSHHRPPVAAMVVGTILGILLAVLQGPAHAAVLPGGCIPVRVVGSVQLAGEQVDATAYERVCGPRVIVDDVAVTTMGARPYAATVEVMRDGRVVSTSTDGARSADHVVWVQRSGIGVTVRVVVRTSREVEGVTMTDA